MRRKLDNDNRESSPAHVKRSRDDIGTEEIATHMLDDYDSLNVSSDPEFVEL